MAYIKEGTIYGTTNNKYIECKAYWGVEQNTTENYSEVYVSVYYWRTNQGYTTEGTWKGTIYVNGTAYSDSTKVVLSYNSNTWVAATSIRVPHNADGTKTCAISVSGSISGTTLSATYLSQTITLPSIARQATITSAPDFTDEDNPTINYTNKAGTNVTSLQACISLNGDIDIAYRDISKTGSSYTFNLTDAERKILRAGTTGKSRTVKFYIKTVLNGNTYYSSLSKTYSMINAAPTITPTVIDTDATTVALTGNNSRIVKYFSNAQFTIGAKAIKEATLKSQKITCGGKSSTAASGTLNDVESGNFVITATDSRGFTTTQTVKKTIVEYVKLTCNIAASTPTATGTMTLTIKGNYFNGGFGAKNNTLTIKYRQKEESGSYSEWKTATATLSGNSYSVSISITGLDYQKKYTFQANAVDALMNVNSAEKSVKSTPVFDWGKDDFRFNVPVKFNASYTTYNTLLWQGAYYMTANQTANLTQSIQSQPNGIVLVFSNYDSANQKANDYDWHCYFIPKYLVDIKGGTGHCFNMMSQSYGDIASKYIYISDTGLTGHDNNTKAATNNGISYNNSKYVMRYVFGV